MTTGRASSQLVLLITGGRQRERLARIAIDVTTLVGPRQESSFAEQLCYSAVELNTPPSSLRHLLIAIMMFSSFRHSTDKGLAFAHVLTHRFGIVSLAACVVLIATVLGQSARGADAGPRPNVVVIMTDDQGYGDIS